MRGRFNYLSAGYVDDLAVAKARNPYYRENPPGVGNEPVEPRVLCGLIDFLIYVFALFPLVMAHQAFFFLWMATIPFAFLSAVMPVGPVSAWYWRRNQPAKPKAESTEDLLASLRARRQWLQELALQSVKIENELTKELENAGDLRFAFEAQIRQAQDSRTQISREITRIDAQVLALDLSRLP